MTEQYKNQAHSILSSSLSIDATDLHVADSTSFPTTGDFRIVVDDEIMIATDNTANVLTVTRAAEDTTAAIHNAGVDVAHVLTAGSLPIIIGQVGAGLSGYSGYSGVGASGYSGYSGVGVSGYSGYSGVGASGYSGYSGVAVSGYSGYSGYSGSNGTGGGGTLATDLDTNTHNITSTTSVNVLGNEVITPANATQYMIIGDPNYAYPNVTGVYLLTELTSNDLPVYYNGSYYLFFDGNEWAVSTTINDSPLFQIYTSVISAGFLTLFPENGSYGNYVLFNMDGCLVSQSLVANNIASLEGRNVSDLATLLVNGSAQFTNNGIGTVTITMWGGGAWIDMPTAGPSGLGSGGAGDNAWIAYACDDGEWFINANAGDICYRNTDGNLLFGTNGGVYDMALMQPVTDTSNATVNIATLLTLTPQTEPDFPVEGMIYADSTSHQLRFFNGTIWKQLDNTGT